MGQKSTVINLSKYPSGKIYKNNENLSRDNFEKVIQMAVDSATEAVKRLNKGDISINPYKLGKDETGCQYCIQHL
jgi:ATP-dependent helicase/DNAse subunit B